MSTVEGHSGKLIFGKLGGVDIMAMKGRFHYYEGYSMKEVTFPIRVMYELGVKTLFVSNAAGGMNPQYKIGDLMVITDHINLFPEHPLRGKNFPTGPRFPDMHETYDHSLINLADEIAAEKGIALQHGVYVGVQGPTFETPAEYKMYRLLGGDTVGMSTIPEVIVAHHCGIRTFGISVVTDLGGFDNPVEVSHEEVQEAANKAQPLMTTIMREMIIRSEKVESKQKEKIQPRPPDREMEIANIGEFGLIGRLTSELKPQNVSTRYGVGDDCAVLSYPDSEVLITTDLLMEGVHFDLTYIDLQHLGYKAVMVNLSDVFAMNGTPRQITVSLAISKRFTVEDIEQLYKGMRLACEKWNVDIVGGDTTSSFTGLAISITCIGEASKEDIVYRNGARDTDLICVSGDLGAAYMGLQLLEREKSVYYSQYDDLQKKLALAQQEGNQEKISSLKSQLSNLSMPDFSGKEYLLQRQLQAEARGDIIQKLRQAGIRPTAMMDVSDGLSSELRHICKQSGVGCRIYEKQLPIDYQTAVMAEELNMNVTTCALNGGEDYELVFTVPIGDHEKIQEVDDVHLIGHITEQKFGHVLVSRDGQEFELKAQGWNFSADASEE